MPNKSEQALSRPSDQFGWFLHQVATALATFGGFTLLIIVCISFVSILGRFIFSSPLLGDFELVEMGCAVAIASFLPLCHLEKGNVIVDFVTSGLSQRAQSGLDAASSLLFAIVAGFFTWRMFFGVQDMFYYNEETMLLQFPVWVPFVPVVFSFFVLTICCCYAAFRDVQTQFKEHSDGS